MKVKTVILWVIVLVALTGFFTARQYFIFRLQKSAANPKAVYYCPMHPTYTLDRPGDCQICGMSLVKKEVQPPAGGQKLQAAEKKILYYRNPMNPQVTSPVPMKDEMGMDYVPVYAEETESAQVGVNISAEKQQLIGVKKGKVEKRNLSGQILTVGKVAYDPALYTAQMEYLQAMKSVSLMQKSGEGYIEKQSAALIKTARQKLLLMGMGEPEIEEMEKRGTPEQSLYLPDKEDKTVWVYITVYEYEAQLVKSATPVEVRTAAYPGELFEGRVISIAPILESATRSFKVRARVDNPQNKLKLDMYVNVAINYTLGEKLAVPAEAVMHTGTKDTVFVAKPDGYFESRVVSLGAKANNYYEVLKGLAANEEVVTSGNFLIDSETKLNAGIIKAAEPNQ